MRHMIVVAAAGSLLLAGNSFGQGAASAVVGGSQQQVKTLLERGYRLKGQNRTAEAQRAFGGVLKNDPNNQAAQIELGYLSAAQKRWAAAAKYFAAASEQDPSNLRLKMDLAYAYQNAKQPEQAEEQFKAVAEAPGEFQAQAQTALDSLRASDPAAAKSRKTLEQGYAALRKGDKAAARKAFESAAAGKDAAALKQLGYLNLQEGKATAAAANFEEARSIDSNDHVVSLQLGYIYERLQKKDEARGAFESALASSDPKIHDAAEAALKRTGGASADVPAAAPSAPTR